MVESSGKNVERNGLVIHIRLFHLCTCSIGIYHRQCGGIEFIACAGPGGAGQSCLLFSLGAQHPTPTPISDVESR